MADDHQQSGPLGDAGRSKRAETSEIRRVKSGTRDAEETQGSARVTVDAGPERPASNATQVKPEPEAPATTFEPAEIDLSPLDPSQNGVLDALSRIERNTAASGARQPVAAAGQGGSTVRATPGQPSAPRDSAGRFASTREATSAASEVARTDSATTTTSATGDAGASNAGMARDAAGRFTSTQALAGQDDSGDAGGPGLQQKIRRVKRIERRVERTLPPAERSTPSSSSSRRNLYGGGDDTSVTVNHSGGRSAIERRQESREAAEATADATAKAVKDQGATDATPAPGESSESTKRPDSKAPQDGSTARADAKPLTVDDLRKLPLRGEGGRFLSKDEKQNMTTAELSHARSRQKQDKAKDEEKKRGVLGKAARAAEGTLGGQSSAGDAAGTAAGGSYYLAAKEIYDAANEFGGKDSKAQQLYQWAKKKRQEKAGERDQDDSDNAQPAQQGDPKKAASQRKATADAVESQAKADAKQREARSQRQQAAADARESRHRSDAKQADSIHDDGQESLADLEETNEDGFEAVVRAIKRYSGGGGNSWFPWPNRRGGGRRGGRRGGRGRGSRRGPRQPRTPRTRRTPKTPTRTAQVSTKAIEAAKNTRTGRAVTQTTAKTAQVSKGAINAAKATRAGQAATQATAKTAQVSKGAIQAAKATRAGSAAATTARVGGKVLGTTARLGGRAAGAAAAPLAGYFAFQDTKAELEERDDLTDKQKNVMAGSSAAGAGGGAAAGAAAGGAAGAAIGSVVPLVGTAIGGGVGAIAGGALGAWGGEKAGRELGDAVAERMDDELEAARKELQDRESDMQAPEKREVKWYNPSTWTDRGGAGVSPQAEVNKGKYTAGGDAELANETGFGRVAEKYESSGMGVGTVSTGKNDAGGVSYGIHQLASDTGTMDTFLASKEGEAYRDKFKGMEAGDADFTAQYKKIAANDGDNFAAAQQDFIKRTHYDPVERYASASGFNTDSEAIQEALYSQSVQHSGEGNEKIIDDARSRVGPDASEDEVIDALYDARGDYASQYASANATTNRYAREREDVKAISERGEDPEARPEVDVAPAEAVASANQSARQPDQQAPDQAANDPALPSTIAAPVEPDVTGEPVTPIDPAKAQQVAQAPTPAQQPPQPPAKPAPAATQGPAGNDGKDGTAGNEIRGGTSAPGVKDIQMGFDDTTLTLMAMDRI